MGAVCAKNDAGKVTNDAPTKNIKRQEKTLTSMQGPLAAKDDAKYEKKFIDAEMDFNTDKGVDKKADQVAQETAEKWCAMDLNKGWSYTGVWKNERSTDDSKEVSYFEVSKLVVKDVQGGITLTNE